MSYVNDYTTIAHALSFVDAHDRDRWVQMGMAVKSEMGDDGFELWRDWSAKAPSYNKKAAIATWKSFKPTGGVTIASLFHEAKAGGWRSDGSYIPPTLAERKALEAERAAASQAAEATRQEGYAAAAKKAANLLAKSRDVAANHPYLAAKGIKPYGARQLRDCLFVPLSIDGQVTNLQVIGEDGTKRFLTGGQVKGASLVLGRLKDALQVLLCEGWATGCTLHEATGLAVVVAFDAGNLVAVAKRLHGCLAANVMVLVCGDVDESGTGQAAAKRAVAALSPRAILALPSFTPAQKDHYQQAHGKPPSDYNDLHQLGKGGV